MGALSTSVLVVRWRLGKTWPIPGKWGCLSWNILIEHWTRIELWEHVGRLGVIEPVRRVWTPPTVLLMP